MKKVLLDSDVILDFFLNREPHAAYTGYVLSQIELGHITGYVTPVIISNVYYLLRRNSSHDKVIKHLSQLILLIDVLVVDKSMLIKSMNSNFKDFEDAIQNYSAEVSGEIDTILTRNIKDYRHSQLSVMTPEQFYKIKTGTI